MTTRLVIFGGTDFSDGEVFYAADANDTLSAADGVLGERKWVDLSITGAETKANMQTRGWAICDGTTPASQGISSPDITTTPDLQETFIRMSNDETSGSTGGSTEHNHANGAGGSVTGGTFTMALANHLPPYHESVCFMKVKI